MLRLFVCHLACVCTCEAAAVFMELQSSACLHLEISDARLFDMYVQEYQAVIFWCDCRPRPHPVQRPEPCPLCYIYIYMYNGVQSLVVRNSFSATEMHQHGQLNAINWDGPDECLKSRPVCQEDF